MKIKFNYFYSNFEQNPWQEKLYRKPIIKQFVDQFIPKENTKDSRKLKRLINTINLDIKSLQDFERVYFEFYFNDIKITLLNLSEAKDVLIQLLKLKGVH